MAGRGWSHHGHAMAEPRVFRGVSMGFPWVREWPGFTSRRVSLNSSVHTMYIYLLRGNKLLSLKEARESEGFWNLRSVGVPWEIQGCFRGVGWGGRFRGFVGRPWRTMARPPIHLFSISLHLSSFPSHLSTISLASLHRSSRSCSPATYVWHTPIPQHAHSSGSL